MLGYLSTARWVKWNERIWSHDKCYLKLIRLMLLWKNLAINDTLSKMLDHNLLMYCYLMLMTEIQGFLIDFTSVDIDVICLRMLRVWSKMHIALNLSEKTPLIQLMSTPFLHVHELPFYLIDQFTQSPSLPHIWCVLFIVYMFLLISLRTFRSMYFPKKHLT